MRKGSECFIASKTSDLHMTQKWSVTCKSLNKVECKQGKVRNSSKKVSDIVRHIGISIRSICIIIGFIANFIIVKAVGFFQLTESRCGDVSKFFGERNC